MATDPQAALTSPLASPPSPATTLLVRVERLDRAITGVQLCDPTGRPWAAPIELRPAHWHRLRHTLALGEAMRGEHLEVPAVTPPRPATTPARPHPVPDRQARSAWR